MLLVERRKRVDKKTEHSFESSSLGDWKSLLVGGLVGGVVGAILVGLVAWVANTSIDSGLSENRLIQQLDKAREILTVWDILAFPVLILLVFGVHEIGHVLGGLSQGMRFLMLIVGPFGWHASSSGLKFQWNTTLALMGGLAAMLPKKIGATRRQLLVLIAGGPLASLVLAMFAIALASVSGPRFMAYCTFVAATSFGIFVVTLIPVRSGGFMSDGLQIIDVLRGGNSIIGRNSLMQIFAQSLDGVRPRDWDSSAIDELARADCKDSLQRTGGLLYLLAHAMDCRQDGDIERYRALLESSVDRYPSGFKQSIHIELAICAWLARDTDAVRRHLKASRGGIVEKSRRFLAQAALAKLEGRAEDCERDRLLAINALERASDVGQRKLTEDQLAILGRGA
ncbi:MAG: M50 family metallopeptidase [Planctomycetota bacterium]